MTLLFDGSFQPGDHWVDRNHFYAQQWNPGTYNSCLIRSSSGIVESSPGGRAGYSIKLTVQSGDNCNAVVEERAALGNETFTLYANTENWGAVSSYFPVGFDTTGEWFMFWQIKTLDGGYPTLAIYSQNNRWVNRWDEVYSNDMGAFSAGWTDWMYHARWTTDATGFYEIYKNGVLVFSRYNIRTLPLRTSQYDYRTRCTVVSETCLPISPRYTWTLQAYRNPISITQSVYLSNVKIGTTREDVDAATCPPPLCDFTIT